MGGVEGGIQLLRSKRKTKGKRKSNRGPYWALERNQEYIQGLIAILAILEAEVPSATYLPSSSFRSYRSVKQPRTKPVVIWYFVPREKVDEKTPEIRYKFNWYRMTI